MKISNEFDHKRLYRGLVFENGLPMTADNIHESTDILYDKNKSVLESLFGSGILSNVAPSYDATGITLSGDLVLNIQGDIVTIQTSDNSPIVPVNALGTSISGDIFIVGWYQLLSSSDTMREYGGVQNSVIGNNLIDSTLSIQTSKRIQFRWDVVVNSGTWDETTAINIPARDATGALTSGTIPVTPTERIGDIYVSEITGDTPAYMKDGILYIIPVISYTYNPTSSTILSAIGKPDRYTQSNFIVSTTQPTGSLRNGMTWYNPTTQEFKRYINGDGFIKSTTQLGFLQYTSETISTINITNANVLVNIDIDNFSQNDILRVLLNGIELLKDIDYTIDYTGKMVNLLSATISVGDRLTMISTKIVDATNVSTVSTAFYNHIGTSGSSEVAGHLKLTNDAESSVSDPNTAVSPAGVLKMKTITDDTTNVAYHFGIDNGILYIETNE